MESAEQQARDLLDRMGIEGAQSMTAGDVVELANMIAEIEQMRGALIKARAAHVLRTWDDDALAAMDAALVPNA